MDGDNRPVDEKSEEFVELIREIRERVRGRHPFGSATGGMLLPDLTPVVHARDAAESKVASIGTVNPRAGGALNALIQSGKKLIARMLDWHVREQVEFNRAAVAAVEAILEALNENNRVLSRLARLVESELVSRMEEQAQELKDVRAHWAQWRQEWEHKLSVNEVQFLRGLADLQSAFQHRATLMETNFREVTRGQHADYLGALDRGAIEIQKRLWADLEKVRTEFERLIHTELRLVRQRAAISPATAAGTAAAPAALLDYARLADRFRGSEEYVREKQKFYLPYFRDCREVLDLGCGRGEFLELMKEAGVGARGIDASAESAALCRQKGLGAEAADLFTYLDALPERSLDGIFCSQVVEHLPPESIPAMLRLCAARLARGGLLAIETPNPECLAIFASHFYLDPTHTRPVPSRLMRFYCEEAGLGQIEVHTLTPAIETMPSVASLPEDFRAAFFGALDYAILARRLD